MTARTIRHEFVETIPDELDDGVVYVCIPYATAVHRCACGCGGEVVTPFTPTDWRLIFDGKTISLHPSIGNWSFPCQSHYWIRDGVIEWAPKWSRDRIARGRRADQVRKTGYFDSGARITADELDDARPSARRRLWSRLLGRLFGR
jgi:Family of unknown function (DUF6527)